MSIYELRPASLPPARERYVFFDAHFQAIGPAAPQFSSAHPGNPLEQRAHRLQVHGKKSALYAALERADDLVARDMLELAPHDDGLEQEHRGLEQDARACGHEQRKRKRLQLLASSLGN